MKLLEWFLQFFSAPRAALPATPKRVKFLEGTEWICPKCEATLGVARKDIYHGDLRRSSEWDIKDLGFWTQSHCGEYAVRFSDDGHRILFLTPTGWVG